MNKIVTIAAEERGTNNIFVPIGIATGYTWNSTPIDRTQIIRSIPSIGRGLCIPIDINLNALPEMIRNNGKAVLDCLKFTTSSLHLSSAILKILIEDSHTTHAKRIKNTRNLIVLKPSDIVMARTAIQSNKKKEKVA